ncbi:MAG: ribosome maturation factor RimM [Gammaproteobacteria bacterium]
MTQTDTDKYIIVGQIGATYGVRGWLKILSYTEEISNILDYNPWYLEDKTGWKPIQVEDGQNHGKGIIAKITGYNNPEDARLISGKKIAILRSQLPELSNNEYYWSDLKGLTVIDQHGVNLGKVIYLMATGANDVLVVKGTKEHAIPYLPGKVVKSIDLAKGEMHVDWEVI